MEERKKGLLQAQAAVDESLGGAVKSSAGDKHNTERAHLQLQAEKLGQQFKALDAQRSLLSRVQLDSKSDRIHWGSLVITDQQKYFIAIAAGPIIINDETVFVIAPQSPIGKLLLGKPVGDTLEWNRQNQRIVQII